eukprot:CAMPEP_0168391986 /NCGR_PEP_ID=MMETSP0228-20121227/18266_1 /TAXON_ID=133427 /ORGANISM="Protoceratium reticulatum, Strain CCCM 535 (=CCMP 1889)" /LENGTH=613 /DNA_ID=CAMNT_0008405315 /DNA_START=95 /DNA_END=1934 /DNA_ORIENTATION=+
MIKYKGWKDMLFRMEGSVMPFAMQIALPCAFFTGILKYAEVHALLGFDQFLALYNIKGTAYGAFSSLLGFLVVFRTSQAYSRYWSGGGLMQQMCGSWFDACSSLVAFCRMSKAPSDQVMRFQHTMMRLFSILNALALTSLQGADEEDYESLERRLQSLEIIDMESFDSKTIKCIQSSGNKIELVFHWIQAVVVEHIESGVLNIAPPILSRAFNELADGMVKFHDCMKISLVPFPFPYSQTTLFLLICHWAITPVMICTWTAQPVLAFLFSFLVVLCFWSLYAIAGELENPFGDDANDLDAVEVQGEMNSRLLMLVVGEEVKYSPKLLEGSTIQDMANSAVKKRVTLDSVWGDTRPSHMGDPLDSHSSLGSRRNIGAYHHMSQEDGDAPLLTHPAGGTGQRHVELAGRQPAERRVEPQQSPAPAQDGDVELGTPRPINEMTEPLHGSAPVHEGAVEPHFGGRPAPLPAPPSAAPRRAPSPVPAGGSAGGDATEPPRAPTVGGAGSSARPSALPEMALPRHVPPPRPPWTPAAAGAGAGAGPAQAAAAGIALAAASNQQPVGPPIDLPPPHTAEGALVVGAGRPQVGEVRPEKGQDDRGDNSLLLPQYLHAAPLW